MADGTLLDYTIDPAEIDYSVSDTQESVVTLAIIATNNTGKTVECSDITFRIPVGFGAESLTEDPSTITSAPGATTPWAIGGGADTWVAVPLPPVTSVDAGSSVSFELGSIIVNRRPGAVALDIDEETDQTRHGSVSVKKSDAVPAGSTPVINSFAAAPAQVAQGGTSTLSWQVGDALQLVLDPGPVNLPDSKRGTLPINPQDTTVYTITALGSGGQAQAAATVTVMPVSIESFTAEPATPVAPGTPVTLRWSCEFAASCAIDQGIGPVPAAGSQPVTPTQTTVYTLSALGRSPQSKSVTVVVGDQR